MFVGFALLIAGVLLILEKMNIIYGDFWDYFWPIILIAMGAKFIFDNRGKRTPD